MAVSDSYAGLGKVEAKLVLHNHKDKDQFFLVLRGCPDNEDKRPRCVLEGDGFLSLPRGVWLKLAEDEAYLALLEKKTTMNTGEVQMRALPQHVGF